MKRRPTLQDVARESGYSVSAVSLALRGLDRFPKETRAVIRQAAERLDYRPDPLLSALSAHRWRPRPAPAGTRIAMIADQSQEGFAGASRRAAELGYLTEVFRLRDYPRPRRLSRILANRGIRGVIVGRIFTDGFFADFDWTRLSAVACDEGFVTPPIHLVMPDHFHATREAWDRVRADGRRRIGLALFDAPQAMDYHDRLAAYLERQSQLAPRLRLAPLTIPPPSFGRRIGGRDRARAVERMRAWLREWKPDAVLGFDATFHRMLREAATDVGPEPFFVNLWISAPQPGATGMRLHMDDVGRRAAERLDELMRCDETGLPERRESITLDMVWQAGRESPHC